MRRHSPVLLAPLALLLLLLSGVPARAQFRADAAAPSFTPVQPDVLYPAPRIWRLGLILGMGLNSHGGDFIPECDECRFTDGSGSGIVGGLQLEHMISPSIGIALRGLYEDQRAEYSTIMLKVRRGVMAGPGDPSGADTAVIDVERIMNVDLVYFTIAPVLELYPLRDLYVSISPGIGIPVKNSYRTVERLLDDRFVFMATGTNEKSLGTKDVFDIPDVTTPRIDVRAGIGYNLRLSPGVMFTPEVSYVYPLTNISSDDNWSASSIHVLAILKFRL
ncbi:MAG: hypothetical protein HY962_03680 [Ignavibacteriae bacterium]|nr:hypothetical protein [Ignavibacteriota bacterium]